jgi:hypothetical protein
VYGVKYFREIFSRSHVYWLEPQAQAAKFAAENVRVAGELENDTIRIRRDCADCEVVRACSM